METTISLKWYVPKDMPKNTLLNIMWYSIDTFQPMMACGNCHELISGYFSIGDKCPDCGCTFEHEIWTEEARQEENDAM